MDSTLEQPKSVNDGDNAEKPKDERDPVQRLCRLRSVDSTHHLDRLVLIGLRTKK